MAWKNKVVWSEGMLLQPQHLQQHDRYWQSQLEARVASLRPYSWGFSTLKLDEQQLALGKVAPPSIGQAQITAVFADGWGWYALYLGLVVLGLVSQRRYLKVRNPVRTKWGRKG